MTQGIKEQVMINIALNKAAYNKLRRLKLPCSWQTEYKRKKIKILTPKMAYSFEEEEMYISKIFAQANLKCQKCGSRVSLEKNKGFSNFICIWRPCRTRRTV